MYLFKRVFEAGDMVMYRLWGEGRLLWVLDILSCGQADLTRGCSLSNEQNTSWWNCGRNDHSDVTAQRPPWPALRRSDARLPRPINNLNSIMKRINTLTTLPVNSVDVEDHTTQRQRRKQ